ncbi:MAG: polymerase delta prime subunit [Pseudomonadota bacterium]
MVDVNPVVKSLLALAGNGRMPASLLLYGAHAGSVRSAAHQLLTALFCPRLCGDCADCRAMVTGEHPEVFALPEEDAVKIDQVRAAIAHLDLYSSSRADGRRGWRVIVLPQAERLTEQAANALLKTVEEPPEGALILVTARHPRNLLPTLRSRLLALRIPGSAEVDEPAPEVLAAITGVLASGPSAAALSSAEKVARQFKLKAGEFSALAELALNGIYHQSLSAGANPATRNSQVEVMGPRRRLLGELHKLARARNIALNTQLAAEMAAGFSG